MQILNLRVTRKAVGTKFPFDRVYLVKHADRGVIEQLFRCALVMPVDDNMRSMLKELVLDEVIEMPFDRDDETSAGREPKKNELMKRLDGDWILVAPILSKWLRRNEGITKAARDAKLPEHQAPRYVTSHKWYAGKKRGKLHREKSFWPEYAYLQIPGKKIRPICVACPNMIAHQNGDCHLGELQCYDLLSLGLKNHFQDATTTPDAPMTPKDGALNDIIKEILDDGFVPADVA